MPGTLQRCFSAWSFFLGRWLVHQSLCHAVIITVDLQGGGDFDEIHSAIDAAVRSGNYAQRRRLGVQESVSDLRVSRRMRMHAVFQNDVIRFFRRSVIWFRSLLQFDDRKRLAAF